MAGFIATVLVVLSDPIPMAVALAWATFHRASRRDGVTTIQTMLTISPDLQ